MYDVLQYCENRNVALEKAPPLLRSWRATASLFNIVDANSVHADSASGLLAELAPQQLANFLVVEALRWFEEREAT